MSQLLVTCVLPCLAGEWVIFCVSAAIEADGVWAKSGLTCMLLLEAYAILANGNGVWE